MRPQWLSLFSLFSFLFGQVRDLRGAEQSDAEEGDSVKVDLAHCGVMGNRHHLHRVCEQLCRADGVSCPAWGHGGRLLSGDDLLSDVLVQEGGTGCEAVLVLHRHCL